MHPRAYYKRYNTCVLLYVLQLSACCCFLQRRCVGVSDGISQVKAVFL